MFENLYFILVEPQLGENIGSCARVMSNFGFDNLRIVNPRDGWPNEKASELAAHGKYVISNAQVFEEFKDAVADIDFLYALTALPRDMEKKVVTPKEIAPEINKLLSSGLKIGVMLGRERSGLTNEEIILADAIISIKTSEKNRSLNIAQAICVIAYEIGSAPLVGINEIKGSNKAKKHELNLLFEHLEQELDKTDFFKVKEKKERMLQNIRNTFIKAQMTEQEVRTFRGIINSLCSLNKLS